MEGLWDYVNEETSNKDRKFTELFCCNCISNVEEMVSQITAVYLFYLLCTTKRQENEKS